METVRLSTPSIVSSITSTSSKLSSCSSTASFSLGNENKALSSMTNFVDKLTDNEKKELDSMLSKAIYSIESIKVFVENLIIGADCLGLMCDGWSNIRNESIINFVITTPKSVFYKSLPTLTQRHTGNYMANVMIDLIEEVGPGKFYGIVTDNAANMKKAWQEINQKYAHITTYGCIAHSLSLLINDIISLESLKSVVKDGVAIVNNIREDMYERCEKDISQRVKQLITNDIFWDKLKNLHNFLKPIAYSITKIESDDPQMSVIPEIFIEIMKQYENCIENVPCLEFEKETIKNKIQLRKVFSVQPIHLAANVLDPKYFGKQLTPEENIDAATFIHKLSKVCVGIDECKVMNDFAQFKVKEGIFSNSYIWDACVESIKPMVWWNAFCSPTELSKLASKILSLPATSAACERTFSTYKDIHSSKRNRLTNSRAGKIVYVKHNLKLKEETEKQKKKPSIQRDYFKEFLNSYAENGEDDIQNYDSGDDFILETERVNEEKNKSTESTIDDSEISETEEVEINELMNLVRRKS
ncbi:uncharacterized protein LOC126553609 [Aphis gossypii]|uniref:uncharacterized protein LOC126553609 n=1 Tax=Aphis gossypii TaxID=80765 RepID=UPI002158BA50|nr:uncharacterized protein LOC126553609 [Aphis gossypii]